MTVPFIIAGTDTDVGKTVFSAALLLALVRAGYPAAYWKPVQCGVAEGVDTRTVQTLSGLPDEHFFPEAHVFSEPLSPHRAAELDGGAVDPGALEIPEFAGTLLVEAAGGLAVPLTRTTLNIDLFALWGVPVILCARTGLGTINHTLLSLGALKSRDIPVHGIAFIGPENPDNIKTICDFSGVRALGRLPHLDKPGPDALNAAFGQHFDLKDFAL